MGDNSSTHTSTAKDSSDGAELDSHVSRGRRPSSSRCSDRLRIAEPVPFAGRQHHVAVTKGWPRAASMRAASPQLPVPAARQTDINSIAILGLMN